MKSLEDGDEIAIMPRVGALPCEVLGIAIVTHAGEVFIEIEDGRMYATSSGKGLNNSGCIAMITHEHRAALANRPRRRPSFAMS